MPRAGRSPAGQYQSTPSTRACASRRFARCERGRRARRATAARRSAAGAPVSTGSAPAAARTCATTTSTSASSVRAARRGVPSAAAPCSLRGVDADAAVAPRRRAAGRGSASRRAGASSRSTSRPSSWSRVPCAKCVVHLARMHRAARRARTPAPLARVCRCRPDHGAAPARGCISACTAPRHEAVVDEDVLFDVERRRSGARDRRRDSRRRGGAASGPARAPARGSDRPARTRAGRARLAASWAGRGCARRRSAADRPVSLRMIM